MPDADDTIRSPVGVVASLRDLGNGTSKLIFDDVSGDLTINPVAWTFDHFFTSRDFANDALDQMNLTALEYQMIGQNVVARLLALNGRSK
jgi:hypothetical protein